MTKAKKVIKYYAQPPQEFVDPINRFAEQVDAKAAEIDPDNELCWHSMTIGWALHDGMSPEQANKFASFVHYYTSLA